MKCKTLSQLTTYFFRTVKAITKESLHNLLLDVTGIRARVNSVCELPPGYHRRDVVCRSHRTRAAAPDRGECGRRRTSGRSVTQVS